MSIDWLPAGIALLTFGMLATGLITGRMPNAVIEPERKLNPVGYWALAALYGFIVLGSAYLAFKGAF